MTGVVKSVVDIAEINTEYTGKNTLHSQLQTYTTSNSTVPQPSNVQDQ